MSGKAEVITSSEFSLVTDRKSINILFNKRLIPPKRNDDWDEISPGWDTSHIANTKQEPRVSAIIASFVVDVQNQQNYIAQEAIFQRAGNSEGCIGIDYDGKKDSDLYDLEWASRPRRRTCGLIDLPI